MTTRKRNHSLPLFWRIALALLIAAGVLAAVFIVMTAERMIWNARVKAVWTEWEAAHPVSWPVYADDLVKFSEPGPRARERRYGFKNRDGEIVIPAQFTDVSERFSMGRAVASDENGNSGHIDTTGAWVTPPRFILTTPFNSDGVAEVRTLARNGYPMYGYVGLDGKIVIEPGLYRITEFRSGVVQLRELTWIGRRILDLLLPFDGLGVPGPVRLRLFDATGKQLTPGELRRRLKSAPQP